MQKLDRSASGGRHQRWAREILATMRSQHKHNKLLAQKQREALEVEIKRLEPRIEALRVAVNPYQDFIENAHVENRANKRVANYLCDVAQREVDGRLRPHRSEIQSILTGGYTVLLSRMTLSRVLRAGHVKTVELARNGASILRSLPDKIPHVTELADSLDSAATMLDGFIKEGDALDSQRVPLRTAVDKAIFALREELDQINGRLRSHFSQEFIDSLYPELSKKRTAVVDDDTDEDDDTSELPDA